MPSVNIRQLRDTRQLKEWLEAGKTVQLRERDRVIARIVPEDSKVNRPKMPDFAARTRKIFRDRVVPGVATVIKERGRY